MTIPFASRVRHPLFPQLSPTSAHAARQRCSAIYGSVRDLHRAAHGGVRVHRAIFVTHRQDEPLISTSDRDALWREFQVPVFALRIDGAGRVVAYECEAQNGLHAANTPPAADQVCECGRPGRL